jgi:ubiquinone/menaquinone biosynthesis C-methylase UbiE
MRKEEVVHFYQNHWDFIVRFFEVDKTHCINHGYYEKGIHTYSQSVHHMNDFVGTLLGLECTGNQVKHILDAGCGIGGTAIYLAKKYPQVTFKGITIIPEHIQQAKNLAREHKVTGNTDFQLSDFLDTGFPSDQFDAIYLIESASYAPKKQKLFYEMYRILKPGGTLVIIDCFRTHVQLNPLFNKFYTWFCKAWGLPNLISLEEVEDFLKTEGFHQVILRDLTKNVRRTILRCDVLGIPYLFSMMIQRMFQGKKYHIEEDPRFLAAASICSTLIALKKGMTYNAVTGIK